MQTAMEDTFVGGNTSDVSITLWFIVFVLMTLVGLLFVYFVKIKDLKSLAIILKGISFFWVFFTIFNLYLFPETFYLTLFVFMPLIINFYGLKNVKKEIILQLNKKGLSDKEIHLLQLLAGIKKK